MKFLVDNALSPLVAEYDQNGNLVAKFHHDGGGLLAMTRNNSSYWYGFEAIGTTRQLMDGQGQWASSFRKGQDKRRGAMVKDW